MSALLIPFPAARIVRTAPQQKRALRSPSRTSVAPPTEYEIQFEKLAQMIADRAIPGARKTSLTQSEPFPAPRPASDLELEMDPLAERIAKRAKEIMAERKLI